jgi:hypothetical protein
MKHCNHIYLALRPARRHFHQFRDRNYLAAIHNARGASPGAAMVFAPRTGDKADRGFPDCGAFFNQILNFEQKRERW